MVGVAERLKPKILYLVTEDWYFCSHRLPIARAARDAGCEVVVATRVQKHGESILREGFRLSPIGMRRRGKNPWFELQAVRELKRIYQLEQPDLVHNVALKPVLYGSLAARFARVPSIVNALAGLGYVFSSRNWKAALLRPFVQLGFRFFLNQPGSNVIVQNPDDYQILLRGAGLPKKQMNLIRGSGVNVYRFRELSEPKGVPVVTMVSRMLWDKGVGEFVAAAQMLKQRGIKARFVMVGPRDQENPACVQQDKLLEWQRKGVVEWWGQRDDIPTVWGNSHIAVLPSYREGLPKTLLEAAACGRPIITTDTPGCREVVRNEENGLLVPVRNPQALADAIQRLVENPDERYRMGQMGRSLVVEEFSESIVVQKTLDVYRSLLGKQWPT